MPKHTQRDCLIAALKARGYAEETRARTRKYGVFMLPSRPGFFVFVGRAGALRVGRTVTASTPSRYRAALLAEGRALLEG